MALILGATVAVACSWCHEAVVITAKRQICPTCGHRADVARVDCDCGRNGCAPPRVDAGQVYLRAVPCGSCGAQTWISSRRHGPEFCTPCRYWRRLRGQQ